MVERGQADDAVAQLLLGEVRRLREDLLDVERMPLQGPRGVAWTDAFGGEAPAAADEPEVVDECTGEARRRVTTGAALPLEDRLARGERSRRVALRPGVGERERRRLGNGGDEQLHLVLADRLVPGPERELVDLVRELVEVLPDEVDQRGARLGLGACARLAEALGDPLVDVLLRDVVREHVARFRARLGQRRVLLQLLGDEGERRARRGRGEVRLDRLHVCRLPAVREPALVVAAAVDSLDDDEPRVAEEAAGVAERDRLLTRELLRRDELHGLGLEVAPEPAERRLDLRTVAPREQVDGLQLRRIGHGASLLNGPVRTLSRRPSDSTTTRPSSSVRNRLSPGLASSAASVDAVGWP